jgi:hypothetical protein
MAKHIVYGDSSRQGILRGINSLANAVVFDHSAARPRPVRARWSRAVGRSSSVAPLWMS